MRVRSARSHRNVRIIKLESDCAERAQGRAPMKYIQYSLRLPPNLDTALRRLATSRGASQYYMLGECVRIGLAYLSGDENPSAIITELAREVGSIRSDLAHSQRLLERLLFTSCTAAIYGRVVTAGRVDELKISREIQDAFERQLRLSEGE